MERQSTAVKREIIIHVSPEKVWKALTIPSERNKWETRNCNLELKNGAEAFFDYGWNSTYSCKVKEFIENEKLVFEGEDNQLTIWTLESMGNSTKVSIEYTGLWIGDLGHYEMDNMAFGTYQLMRNLKSTLETREDIRPTFWKSWIGVLHTTIQKGEIKGTEIVRVKEATPAYDVLKIGDIIIAVDGQAVHSHDDFEIYVTEKGSGEVVHVNILRNKREIKYSIKTVPFGMTGLM
ncbi:SRPBCC domain-containing protein [Bacillus sp. FJAT-49736]|uniref:SRPBCC domain-containing protein n=1 Tax=Bacillus sp. FJAT-49736 TaxID=2833582 RepID=UPI001BC9E24A|nr:SRPBCC domain-containing protein [Bacillus sp. FJAT-49736]MBS4174907.1 SRPBCC domain-containing protein [Bacillus sp. FJAT-49736]